MRHPEDGSGNSAAMGEVYTGTKFRTVFARRAVSGDERMGELLKWSRRWAALGLVGDTVGNLSFRTVNGFIINRTAGDLGGITRQEFVEVLEAGPGCAAVDGRGFVRTFQRKPDARGNLRGPARGGCGVPRSQRETAGGGGAVGLAGHGARTTLRHC